MLKIRRSSDRLIFNFGIPIPEKDGLILRQPPQGRKNELECTLKVKTLKKGNPFGAEINTLASDGLVPCVAQPPASTVFAYVG